MALTFNLPSQIVVQTAAQWAVDATVYSNKRILVTSDEYYGSTDQRKFKIADGTQTWANLDFMPISQTLAQVLANGSSTNAVSFKSPDSLTELLVANNNIDAYVDDTSNVSEINITPNTIVISTTGASIDLSAASVTKNSSEILTSANITQTITNGVTDKAPSEDAVYDALALKSNITDIRFKSDDVLMREALGSTIIASSFSIDRINTVTTFTDSRIYFSPIYIRESTTLTGVKWYQGTQGNYTADNYNGVGLYSYSAGTLTLVASSTNDGGIWKATANTFASKEFSSTYSASVGIYFIAAIWNNSANVATPTIGAMTNLNNAAVSSGDFSNSAKLYSILVGQTALPSPTQVISGLSAAANASWLSVY